MSVFSLYRPKRRSLFLKRENSPLFTEGEEQRISQIFDNLQDIVQYLQGGSDLRCRCKNTQDIFTSN